MAELSKFEKGVGVTFKDKNLLREAFTHRSYLNENPGTGKHNERLEFLGDAVLELVVTDYLFQKYSNRTEGELTSYRAALVNAVTLSEVAEDLGMNDYLLLSRGESKDQGKARAIILANAYEALVGAIYIDGGYKVANEFVHKSLLPRVDEVVSKKLWLDAKSFFQEKAQEERGVTPAYRILNESGPDHNKKFTVGLYLRDELIVKGEGSSKQEAEVDAATRGLSKMGWNGRI